MIGVSDGFSSAGEALRAFLRPNLKRYQVNNATNAVVENRMTPVGKQAHDKLTVLRGQYLYDTFMQPADGEVTKMQLIKKWVDDGYLPSDIKGACDNMVQIAREKDANGWSGTKNDKGVPVGEDGKKVRLTGEQSAMNMRGIIQLAYGALKFAKPELDAVGYTDKTGYINMRVLAKRALEAKRVEWNGDPVKTEADKERARLKKEQKTVMDARADTMKNLPQLPGETDEAWAARVITASKSAVESAKTEAELNIVTDLFTKLLEKHGIERLVHLAQMVCDYQGITLEPTPEEEREQAEGEAELTEEQVAERMANVDEEHAAH